MRILVTGANGYLGRFLVDDLLAQGQHDLFTLDVEGAASPEHRAKVRQHFALSRDGSQSDGVRDAIATARPEAILHLAALVRLTGSEKEVDELVRSNVGLGVLLLHHGVAAGLKAFVNTGTFWEEMNASGEYSPVDLYAASKRAFQEFLPYYASAHGLKSVTLRLFGLFGPEDTRPNIFRLVEEAVRSGQPLDLTPGEQVLELAYVKDACRAYSFALRALDKLSQPACLDAVEIGSGEGKTLREVIELYTKVNGWKLDARWGARPYRPREVMQRRANLEPAARIIQWKPEYTIRSAFEEMARV